MHRAPSVLEGGTKAALEGGTPRALLGEAHPAPETLATLLLSSDHVGRPHWTTPGALGTDSEEKRSAVLLSALTEAGPEPQGPLKISLHCSSPSD